MKRIDPKKLRRTSEKGGAETRKKDPLEMEEFLKAWRFRLTRKGTGWEGPRAFAQIQRKEMFEFLLCERKRKYDWQAEDLFSRMLDEMKAYRDDAGRRLVKEYYDDIDDFLKKELNRIQKQEDRPSIPELKSLLEDLRKCVERRQQQAVRLRKEKKDWHSGVWQDFWSEIPRNNLVSRKAELDTRLQIELGKILAYYLRPEGITLETIARLILLAYIAGDLAEMKRQEIRSPFTGRKVSVRIIRDNLREIKLHKAASYKRS